MGRFEGAKLGEYRLLKLIGRGGMGEVYKGEDETLKREVAVKVLLPSLSVEEDFCERFLREARSAACLRHPNICQIYAAGRHKGTLYFAMEFIRGRTLASVLDEMGRLPEPTALRIAGGVAAALAYAHSKNIIHRDIKPENIMIEETGRVVVMDFGLARRADSPSRLTRTGTFLGTPEYASPEQCETKDITCATDVYSLGVVLYEMLAGRVPFEAETPLALFARIVREEPSPLRELNPNVSARTASLVARTMSKEPTKRPTAAEVFEEINAILAELPPDTRAQTVSINVAEPATATGVAVSTKRVLPRRRLAIGGAAAAIIAAALLLIFGLSGTPSVSPSPPAPEKAAPLAAVAPARNMTHEESMDWLCSCADLSQLGYLRVVVPTKLKEMGGDVASAAAKLGAEILVESRFWVVGQRLRIAAHARRIKDGVVLASAVAEGYKDEVFAAVDETVAGLHGQLARRLGGAKVARLGWLERYAARTKMDEKRVATPPPPARPEAAFTRRAFRPALKKARAEKAPPGAVAPLEHDEKKEFEGALAKEEKGTGGPKRGLSAGRADLNERGKRSGVARKQGSAKRNHLTTFELLRLAYSLGRMGEAERARAVALLRGSLGRIPERFRKMIEQVLRRYVR